MRAGLEDWGTGDRLCAREVSVNRSDKNLSHPKGGKPDNQISGKLDSMLGTSVKWEEQAEQEG